MLCVTAPATDAAVVVNVAPTPSAQSTVRQEEPDWHEMEAEQLNPQGKDIFGEYDCDVEEERERWEEEQEELDEQALDQVRSCWPWRSN